MPSNALLRTSLSRAVVALTPLLLVACLGPDASHGDAPPADESLGQSEDAISCVTLRRNLGATAAEDTYVAIDVIDPTRQSANYGTTTLVQTGTLGTASRLALLRFDLTPIPFNVPVAYAGLDLAVAQATGVGTASLYRALSPWSETTATWTSFASDYDASTVWGSFQPKAAQSAGGHAVVDVTGIVQAWNAGAYPNHGLAILEDAGARAALGSSEAGNAALRPALTVCYANPSCSDGLLNGLESDLDCGGSCTPCADGQTCVSATDCQNAVCLAGVCQSPTCNDGLQDGTETGVDCGSSCPACPAGMGCASSADCQSGVCAGGICQAPACNDGLQNGGETDVDCGGSCAGCAVGQACLSGADCQSTLCSGGLCVAPSCSDGLQNQGETGVDCGGPCAACADPSFPSVLALLHMNGANNSTAFTDVKGNLWTALGNAKISTAQVKFGGAAGYFDGAGDAVQSPTGASWNFSGATPFTIETWVNGTGTILSSDAYGLVLSIKGGTGLYLWINGVLPWDYTGTLVGTVTSRWHHLALSFDGAEYRVFIDGVQTFSVSGVMSFQSYNYLKLGDYSNGTQPYYNGYLDDFRITKGVARYTANFTPPGQELPNY